MKAIIAAGLAVVLSMSHGLRAASIDINFLNSGQSATHTIPTGETAGIVPTDGALWNQFSLSFGAARKTLNVDLSDSDGNANAATLDFDLNQSYVGNSSATGTPAGDRAMMGSYISWDPVDGTSPEDTGQIEITGLGSAFTAAGYDVYVYFDADVNNRTFTFTLNGVSVTAADSTTWSGKYQEASLFPADANVAVFRGLSAAAITLMADSNTGRAAVNAIQIVSSDHPAADSIQIAFHNGSTTGNAMDLVAAPTAQGTVVNTAATVWNDVINNGGVGLSFTGFELTSSHGLASGAKLAATSGYAGFNSNGYGAGTKDHVMMEGWYGFRSSESIVVSDIPSSISNGGYHVIIYGDPGATTRTMNYTIDDGSGPVTESMVDSAKFSGSFAEGVNYVVFSGLTGSSFTLAGNPNVTDTRSSVNGMQIIAGTPPDPPLIAGFSADDYYVAPGTQVTLSWEAPAFDSLVLNPGEIDAGAIGNGGVGSVLITVDETTEFTLTATKGEEVTTETLRVGAGPERPNIVVFLVDDMGPHDTSVPFNLDASGNPKFYNFNSFYVTPNMESLAASGMRFTSAYAQSVCSPTRCGIMTGRNSARHAVTDWVGGGGNGSPANWNKNGIQSTDMTLPTLLQVGGYRTAHVGKAHFGQTGTSGEYPQNLGFDINIAGSRWGHPYSGYIGTAGYGGMPGMEAYDGSLFLTRALTIEANKVLEQAVADDTPFFLHMAFYAVHSPFTDNPDASGDYSTAVNTNHNKFATMIEGMDIAVGEIRQKLVDLGIAENTLIVFLGDNGSDSPATTQDGLPSGSFSDWPMRGKKGSKWEGGTRVPFIACWAAGDPANAFQQALPIAANSIETDIVTSWDLPVTLLDVAGLPSAAGFGEDGYSIAPYLAGSPGSHRPQEVVIHYPHNHRSDFFSWIRQGDMKLIYNYQTNSHQLYDIPADPTESNDLAAAQPATVTRMARALAQKLDATWGAPGPLKPTISTTAPVGNVISIPNNSAVDVDADGIADESEDLNLNGLVDSGETDPDNSNTDGDRTQDGAEVGTGTDPLDPSSDFQGVLEMGTEGVFAVGWPSKPGAVYRIETSESLDGVWSTEADDVPAHASATITTYELGPADVPRKFFRVALK